MSSVVNEQGDKFGQVVLFALFGDFLSRQVLFLYCLASALDS